MGDILGRKKVYMVGITLFVTASMAVEFLHPLNG